MSADNLTYLPVWKKGSTAEEWFFEVAMVARKHPGRFGKAIVIYEETLPNGNVKLRSCYHGCSTNEALGLMEQVKHDLIHDCMKR